MPTEQQIGIFILGVLVGWLIEWIFVRLFVPNPKKKVETALDAARKENTTLQQQVRDLQAQVAAAKSAAPAKASEPEPETVVKPEPEPKVESEQEAPVTEPAQPEPAEEPAPADVADEGEDELTKLNGIGPKLAEAMQAAGIKRFSQLAVMTTDELSEALAPSGIRYSKASAETWATQAKLAAEGDWQGLKDFTKNG